MRRSKGFTLMEMMATMAVIAIIGAILVPTGLSWRRTYAFSSMARSFSHAVLAARMQALENKSVLELQSVTLAGTINGPPPTNTPYNYIEFSTKLLPVDNNKVQSQKHGLSVRYPLFPGNPTARGDYVMFAGLDMASNLNGAEYEVVSVGDDWAFRIVGPPAAMGVPLPNLAASMTTPTVRNLTACGRFRIVPVRYVPSGSVDYTDENQAAYQSAFDAKGYSVSQVGYSVTFKYDPTKFNICFDDATCANPLSPTGTAYGNNPPNAQPFRFAEIRFDNRGLPNDLTPHTVILQEVVPTTIARKPRQVQYTITASGRVSGGFDSSR